MDELDMLFHEFFPTVVESSPAPTQETVGSLGTHLRSLCRARDFFRVFWDQNQNFVATYFLASISRKCLCTCLDAEWNLL